MVYRNLLPFHFYIFILEYLKPNIIMKIEAIKPGPKPKKDDGSLDKRRRVSPDKKKDYPPLKKHKHKKGD